MTMILKTLLTLLITIGFAGGAVYFGTTSADDSQYPSTNRSRDKPQNTIKDLRSAKKQPSFSDINEAKPRTFEQKMVDLNISRESRFDRFDPQEDFISRIIQGKGGSNQSDEGQLPEPNQKTVSSTQSDIQQRAVQRGQQRAVQRGAVQDANQADIAARNKNFANNTIQNKDQKMGLSKILGKKMRASSPSVSKSVTSQSIDQRQLLDDLFDQISIIKSSELKDQAHLDLVNYSIQHGQFDAADKAVANIKQVELRDTARGQIAVYLARMGQREQAFNIIDQVEIDSLRDVLRLQVIEAIVLPQQPLFRN